MKKYISCVLVMLVLSGCSTVQGWVPSFWDPNQSARITDVRQAIASIDCQLPQLLQAQRVQAHLQWFELYSRSKGSRQQDVLTVIKPMQETTDDWVKRSLDKEGSTAYCVAKKRVLEGQAARAAETILGRF